MMQDLSLPSSPSPKKAYVTPTLKTHGAVEKLTEKVHRGAGGVDCGSGIRFPAFGGAGDAHQGGCGPSQWDW